MAKGDPIRFLKGKYKGKSWWINTEKIHTKCMTFAAVDMGNDRALKTSVRKDSIGSSIPNIPRSYSEAAIQPHPDIESLMDKLCKELTECNVEDSQDISTIFSEKLVLAYQEQKELGHKAVYRNVDYDDTDEWALQS